MKNSMKNLIVISTMLMGLFGIVRAEETTTLANVTVSGEMSTDFTFGDEKNTITMHKLYLSYLCTIRKIYLNCINE